jgi:ATP-dependent Clp protease ATP-binding subunit ClpA
MFERYSQRAHQALLVARLKAGERGANAVEIGDLLVALIIEDQGRFREVLSDLHGLPDAAQAVPRAEPPFLPPDLANDLQGRIGALLPRSQPLPAAADMALSAGVRQVLAGAEALSKELDRSNVEPLHLLAAAVGDESAAAAQIFREAGLTREKVVKAIREGATARSMQGPPVIEVAAAVGPPVYSKRTMSVHFLARLRARTRGAETVEVEDLLTALIIEDQGRFLEALSSVPGVGVDVSYLPRPHPPALPADLASDLLAQLEELCNRSQPLPPDSVIPMSAGASRAVAVAGLLRDALQQSEIEPLHLLAAIVGADPGRGAQVFRDAGITAGRTLEAARAESK